MTLGRKTFGNMTFDRMIVSFETLSKIMLNCITPSIKILIKKSLNVLTINRMTLSRMTVITMTRNRMTRRKMFIGRFIFA
jgi:hypothetical protein